MKRKSRNDKAGRQPGDDGKANANQSRKFSGKSSQTEAQITRLIEMLRRRPHHTYELRACGISHPAGRVLDMERRGFRIGSSRITTVDSAGYAHIGVAYYDLIAEPEMV